MMTTLGKLKAKALRLGGLCPGYVPVARRVLASRLAIVMYHGVPPAPLPVANWCHLAASEFARQIEFLANQYTILPLGEAVDRLARHAPLPKSPAVITFDDGYRSVLRTAYPILEKHAAPVSVFLVTSWIGKNQPGWLDRLYLALVKTRREQIEFQETCWKLGSDAERAIAYPAIARKLKALDHDKKEESLASLLGELGEDFAFPFDSPVATLDWNEIEPMSRSGLIEFGSHTHTHPILSRCPLPMQEEELRLSRQIIEERLGHCDLLAYPNGTTADFTTETKQLAEKLGYRCALGTTPGINEYQPDLFALQRVNVGDDATMPRFERLMIGL